MRSANRRDGATRRAILAILCIACAAIASPARAQGYPDRPIRVIVPFTAGSPNDVLARMIAPQMSAQLGQAVVIENRPGGGTSIGVKAAMTAPPDGYTLLFSNSPTHFIAPLVNKTFTYDPLKDFVPIATVGSAGLMLVIAPEVPAATLKEFVAYAKANPGKLNFGYGQGTLPQLVGELFMVKSATQIASIPYKGGVQAVTDMLGGRIQMNIGTVSTLAPLIRDGKLRALAITSAARSPELPDVPTMAESGFPDVASVSYYGLLGPAELPPDVVKRINAAVHESLKSLEMRTGMARVGFDSHGGTPEDFASLLAGEMKTWIPIVNTTGFQMN